jgi:hypothetical protein
MRLDGISAVDAGPQHLQALSVDAPPGAARHPTMAIGAVRRARLVDLRPQRPDREQRLLQAVAVGSATVSAQGAHDLRDVPRWDERRLIYLRVVSSRDARSRRTAVEDEESSAPRPAAVQALVLHPDLDRLGGIEGYYRKVLPHFRVPVESFEVGRRHGERDGRLRSGLLRPFADYFRLRRRLARADAPVVVLNPSLKLDMVLREGLFQRSRRPRTLTVVFWRGWAGSPARSNPREVVVPVALQSRLDASSCRTEFGDAAAPRDGCRSTE